MRRSGLIVDFGGVLTTSVVESFREFCRAHDIPPDTLRNVLRAEMEEEGITVEGHPTHLLEMGRISGEEFNRFLAEALSEELGREVDPEGLKDRLFFKVRPEPRMIEAVRQLRSDGVATGLLSNSWGGDTYPREIFDDLFDAVVISGEVGLRKPDPHIYRLAAEKIGRDPRQCVFVDDLAVNARGAEKVGMVGLHHSDVDATLQALSGIFELSL